MTWFFALALAVAAPAATPTDPTPSQRRLIGCFGEAFTLVEHVWRIAPTHLDALSERADQRRASREDLAGMVRSAIDADQRSAFAIVKNLEGCMTDAIARTRPDRVTAVMATAVRTELDSALDDVTVLIARASERRDRLQQAVGNEPTDRTLDSPLETYLAFGERIKQDLLRLRQRADALIEASTPRAAK